MGDSKMNKEKSFLKLKLDSPRISSKRFVDGAEAFFAFLEELTEKTYGTKKAIAWFVEVQQGCAEIRAVPVPADKVKNNPKSIKQNLFAGLRLIKSKKKRPATFSDKAMDKIKILSELGEQNGLKVYIIAGNEKEELSPEIAENIDRLSRIYSAIGTIEGELQILAKRKGLFEIEIRHAVSGALVHCLIPQEMLESAKEAFNRRVAATGLIKYETDGTPKNIDVKKLYRFPFNRELPHHDDILGILGGNNGI